MWRTRRPREARTPAISFEFRAFRTRRHRAFRPADPAFDGLECRTLLSALPRSLFDSGRMVERMNVPYPTPTGTFERLNVYSPAGPPPPGGWPVIVAIHGGGWRRLNKTGYGDRIASAFVPNGYVVVAPNYVLSAPGRPTWPSNLEDVRAAVGWVRSNAAALGINPGRVVAMGESAGGNLAELLGTDPGPPGPGGVSTQVQAVIAFSAPADLPALYAQSPWAGRAAAQFLGGTPRQVPLEFAAASPIDHVAPGDPPMLLVHGLQDPLVPVDQSRSMANALRADGVPVQLFLVPGGHNLDFPVGQRNLIRPLLEFLDSTWNDGETLSTA
ncbi:MAG: alpha/beta hydrolase fold domain-containing protein [Isosphaeraceae bacterium]